MSTRKQKDTPTSLPIQEEQKKRQPKAKKPKQKEAEKPHHEEEAGQKIEDIFRTIKKTKKIQKQTKTTSKEEITKQLEEELKKQWKQEEKMMKQGKTEQIVGKKTGDGLKIYSEDELKIGKGGDSKLCPIDCDCCF